MSYLTLSNGIPDFSEAVISLWFRVPEDTIKEVEPADLFEFIIPLVTFGKQEKKQDFRFLYGQVSDDPDHPYYGLYGWETVGNPYDVEPSYIGLFVRRQELYLVFNLQMNKYGTYDAVGWVIEPPAVATPVPDSGEPPQFTHIIKPKDITPTIKYGPPEFFNVEMTSPLDPDVWHHLLLSFDVSGKLSIASPYGKSDCKLWYAVDDVDYRGPDNLLPYRDSGDNLGANIIMTKNIHQYSKPITSHDFLGTPVPDPSGSYTPEPIQTSGEELGLPASAAYEDCVMRVELAEFQMWTGITLDTGKGSNRRVFIDDEGKPVPPSQAEELLGKPDILLHGSGNWKTGKNTGLLGTDEDGNENPGLLGTDEDGNENPDGQFQPTGGIEPYKPDPVITPDSDEGSP